CDEHWRCWGVWKGSVFDASVNSLERLDPSVPQLAPSALALLPRRPAHRNQIRKAAHRRQVTVVHNLKGQDPLKKLFWTELNYDKVNSPLSRKGWGEQASSALADDPVLFATGGKDF